MLPKLTRNFALNAVKVFMWILTWWIQLDDDWLSNRMSYISTVVTEGWY